MLVIDNKLSLPDAVMRIYFTVGDASGEIWGYIKKQTAKIPPTWSACKTHESLEQII
jgi:hypothetical protein